MQKVNIFWSEFMFTQVGKYDIIGQRGWKKHGSPSFLPVMPGDENIDVRSCPSQWSWYSNSYKEVLLHRGLRQGLLWASGWYRAAGSGQRGSTEKKEEEKEAQRSACLCRFTLYCFVLWVAVLLCSLYRYWCHQIPAWGLYWHCAGDHLSRCKSHHRDRKSVV